MPPPKPLPCPECAALVWDHPAHIDQHTAWHERIRPFGSDDASDLAERFAEVRRLAALADDDAGPPTAKIPPVRDTIRRRPPVPGTEIADQAARLRTVADELQALAAAGVWLPRDPRMADELVWDCALHPGQLWFTEAEWIAHVRDEHPWGDE